MDTVIISTLITCAVTLTGIFVSARTTQDKVTHELDKKNELQSAEIKHIKEEIIEMKKDIKEHNNYGKKFLEMQGELNVLSNREAVSEHRLTDLERKVNV